MKSLETHYDGYHFRSRLEARWATFFNWLCIPYAYEHEGYEFDDGTRYLPDFWLPRQRCWVEIKGKRPNKDELHKAELLAAGSQSPVYLEWGNIQVPERNSHEADSAIVILPDGHQYWRQWWAECPRCSCISKRQDAFVGWLPCACYPRGSVERVHQTPNLLAAYQAARSARF